ncbi:hypothetical protein VTN77DRAFT_5012 [Rasamsonia byssochlamydoides]|uniref:uncharacterized protein n=1 Tax=Rasamsonia byssochlamydoides TaxID=89139 RepID=UPI003744009C
MAVVISPQTASLLTGSVGLFLIALLTTPAVSATASRLVSKRQESPSSDATRELYQDEDGTATEESVKAFSDKIQRFSIAVLSVVGFLTSLALAIIVTLKLPRNLFVEHWLQFAGWFFLAAHVVALFSEPSSTKRFRLGIYGFLASLLTIAIPVIETVVLWPDRRTKGFGPAYTGLIIAQIVAAFCTGLLYVLLPRRPDVFHNGKPVDRQFTVSLLARLTFAWVDRLLKFAIRNRGLEIDDLHVVDNATRSINLRAKLETVKGSRRLWKALFITHWRALIMQHTLTLLQAFLSFSPQMALLGILRSLEAREMEIEVPWKTWGWVLGLGLLMMFSSTIEAWLFWSVWSKLAIPIQEQLAAVVFAKSMRRKDVKGTKKTKQGDSPDESATPLIQADGEAEEDDEANLQKTRQSIINLVAVDSKRIAECAAWNYLLPSALLKLSIACTFLVKLLGWRATLAGLAVSVIVTPANIYAAQKYSNAQGDLMKYRDQKMAVLTEVLQGIRQVKFSALEGPWQKKISDIRNTELLAQWTAFMYDIALISIWILGPIMLSAVSLAVYALIHGELSASVAFTSISIFGSLEMSLAVLPELISDFIEAWISMGRIDKHLDAPEKTQATVPGDSISFEGAAVAWPADEDTPLEERYVLRNLNLQFPRKGLTVISGKTGSGKSLLLAAILGECDILDGVVKVPQPPALEDRYDDLATSANWIIDDAIAYVAQTPWIENASIKDNILFGLPYDQARYRKVLFACALKKDLEMLPDGELTDIGANGINLSGGQKWRVSFARALYSRAGILVMDDIFSAVDAHTGRHLYEHALTGELGQGRTRILVTHHVALCLPRTDYSVFLEDGTVRHAGTIEELRKSDSLASILVKEHETEDSGSGTPVVDDEELSNENGATLQKILSNSSRRSSVVDNNDEATKRKVPRKFVEEEKRETGSIRLAIYKKYLKTGGSVPFWLMVLLVYVSYIVLLVGRSWWVNIWTGSASAESHQYYVSVMNQAMSQITIASPDNDLWFYLGVYVAMSVIACVVGTLRYYCILSASIRASRNLFNQLTYAVLRAPLRWLDTVPVGRILNRFTADFHLIDSRLGYDVGFMAYHVLEVVGIIAAGVLVSPLLIVFAVILLGVCLQFAVRYLAGAREIKRLESNAKSPIFEQFGSALAGLGTIRAFTKVETYIHRMYGLIDRHAQAWWHLWLFNRWFSFRMNLIGALFSMITAALIVSIRGMRASLAGFALSFALQYTGAISWSLRQYANVELEMNATERVVEYSNIAIENQGGEDVPAAWPTEGKLEVENLVVGYAPDLPPVLKGLSFTVEQNQRVGVVGRTGAGKSSLTLALFRFLEPREGRIVIDGIDVSKIKLYDLRSRLAIIPQDPVLFSGTIRSNLDPFDEYSDAELYDALERVHLIGSSAEPASASGSTSGTATPASASMKNANIFTSLQSPISEGGLNLSQGQRQLLCLARAIVSRPKIMVLDEATSAVDMATDALIQRSIRSEFGRNATTLLVIAHRLSTIVDFDRILVMDAGRAVEFGTPRELMAIEGGVFRSLVEESGERKVLEEIIFREAAE